MQRICPARQIFSKRHYHEFVNDIASRYKRNIMLSPLACRVKQCVLIRMIKTSKMLFSCVFYSFRATSYIIISEPKNSQQVQIYCFSVHLTRTNEYIGTYIFATLI